MPDARPKSPFLESLRRRSEAMRDQASMARRPADDAVIEIDRCLWQAFRWLDEALQHLEVIKPQVAHEYRLDNVLTIARPWFDRGFVSYRRRPLAGRDVLDHIEIFYRMTTDKPIVIRVQSGAVNTMEQRLRTAQLDFHYQTEQDDARVVRGVFTVQPAVSASARFVPDYRRRTIEVTLHNVDRFESVILEFPGDAIDDAVLEDLVHFMLGEANTFLKRAPLAGVGKRRREAAPEPTPEPEPDPEPDIAPRL